MVWVSPVPPRYLPSLCLHLNAHIMLVVLGCFFLVQPFPELYHLYCLLSEGAQLMNQFGNPFNPIRCDIFLFNLWLSWLCPHLRWLHLVDYRTSCRRRYGDSFILSLGMEGDNLVSSCFIPTCLSLFTAVGSVVQRSVSFCLADCCVSVCDSTLSASLAGMVEPFITSGRTSSLLMFDHSRPIWDCTESTQYDAQQRRTTLWLLVDMITDHDTSLSSRFRYVQQQVAYVINFCEQFELPIL